MENGGHAQAVTTLSIVEPNPIELDKLNDWLGTLLWEKHQGMEIYRMKAVLNVHDANELHILQVLTIGVLGLNSLGLTMVKI